MPDHEWVAYVNGDIIPEREAKVSIFDDGFMRGDAAYDSSRTFHGRIFQLEEHVDRLLRSCAYIRLDPGMGRQEILDLSEEITRRNAVTLAPSDDMWITQRIARGVTTKEGYREGATVVIECSMLPLAERAVAYRDGVDVCISSVRRNPPWAQSAQAKLQSGLTLILAHLDVQERNPDAWALLLDEDGHLAEGYGGFGFNAFIVRDGVALTPKVKSILPGISRANVLRLAAEIGIPAREADIDLFDVTVAEEMFLTSTSMCILPVRSCNGRVMEATPGPVTARLQAAYNDFVGLDIAAQSMAHLDLARA